MPGSWWSVSAKCNCQRSPPKRIPKQRNLKASSDGQDAHGASPRQNSVTSTRWSDAVPVVIRVRSGGTVPRLAVGVVMCSSLALHGLPGNYANYARATATAPRRTTVRRPASSGRDLQSASPERLTATVLRKASKAAAAKLDPRISVAIALPRASLPRCEVRAVVSRTAELVASTRSPM